VYKTGYRHLDLQHLLMLLFWLLLTEIADNTKTSDINENEQDDLGRGFVCRSGRN
jgi:hypothetical protein